MARKFWYLATHTTPADLHVHCNRVFKGETYLVGKTDDKEFVSVTGILYNKDGGREKVYDKHLHISKIKPFVELIELSELLTTCPNS